MRGGKGAGGRVGRKVTTAACRAWRGDRVGFVQQKGDSRSEGRGNGASCMCMPGGGRNPKLGNVHSFKTGGGDKKGQRSGEETGRSIFFPWGPAGRLFLCTVNGLSSNHALAKRRGPAGEESLGWAGAAALCMTVSEAARGNGLFGGWGIVGGWGSFGGVLLQAGLVGWLAS